MSGSPERAKCYRSGGEKFITYKVTKNISAVISEVLRTDLYTVELQGHDRLFMESIICFYTKTPIDSGRYI